MGHHCQSFFGDLSHRVKLEARRNNLFCFVVSYKQ